MCPSSHSTDVHTKTPTTATTFTCTGAAAGAKDAHSIEEAFAHSCASNGSGVSGGCELRMRQLTCVCVCAGGEGGGKGDDHIDNQSLFVLVTFYISQNRVTFYKLVPKSCHWHAVCFHKIIAVCPGTFCGGPVSIQMWVLAQRRLRPFEGVCVVNSVFLEEVCVIEGYMFKM